MKRQTTRKHVLTALAATALMLAVWAASHLPAAFANSGGQVTYYTLTLCTPNNGTITADPIGPTYVAGTVVTLTADSDPEFYFGTWTGAATGNFNPITVTMNANKSVCATFDIDNTIPVITLIGDDPLYVECGDAWSDPGATANDNANGNITSWIVTGGDTVDPDTPGEYVITYDVTDEAENDAVQVTRTVIVQDTTIPVITLLGDSPVNTALGGSYVDAGATATDDCDGDLTANIAVGGDTVDDNTLGPYLITYDVQDAAGNHAAQATRTVNVVDLTPPVITLLGDNPQDINLGDPYSDPGATASDNVDGDITANIVVGGDVVDVQTAGVYAVTYNVIDAAGNDAVEVTRAVRIWPSLTLAVNGEGGTTPAPDLAQYYAPGTEVDLLAFADNVDNLFDQWTGDAVADSQSAATTIFMDGPKAVTANFVAGYQLGCTVASGAGSISRSPDKALYRSGAQVVCVAEPANGYEFDHWTTNGAIIAGTVNDPQVTVQMDSDTNLSAHFSQLTYTLSLSASGNGTVSPASGSFHYGDPLTLTATAESGWYFAYWMGGLSGNANPKMVTVQGDITAAALFVEEFSLTVLTLGNGSVSPGSGTYIPGDPVTQTATAGAGWRFDHWEGDIDAQEKLLNFTMADNYTITAVFVQEGFLTVGMIGSGSVTLDPAQPVEGYAPQTEVTLTALPDSGWLFEGWSGALDGDTNPEFATIPVASEIVAEFRPAQTLELEIAGVGAGTVQVSDTVRTYTANPDGTYTVPLGTELTLTPNATSGCFYHWDGDLTGYDAPGALQVTGDHSVTAVFSGRAVLDLMPMGSGTIVLDPPQPPEGYCPGTEIEVTAVPDSGWVFTKWGSPLLNLEWDPSQTFRTFPGEITILAFFDERPGIDSLDMVGDLGAYLVATGVNTDPSEVQAYDYDFGAEELDENLDTVYTANGIPDAAEMTSLQSILQGPSIELKDGGVSHMALWQIYLANLAQAQTDLSAQSAAVQRAVAAYMTVGTFGHQGKVAEDVLTHFSVALDLSLYRNAGDRWFGAEKDMDGDGVTNKAEWDYALDEVLGAQGTKADAAGAYADNAPDPDEGGGGGGGGGLPPDGGSIGDFANECGSTAKLTVMSVGENSPLYNLTVEARVVTPDGSHSFVIAEGEEAWLPLGSEVHVEARDPDWFSSWSAAGTLLTGSANPNDSFILIQSTTLIGGSKGSNTVEYQEQPGAKVVVSVAGGDDPLELERGDGQLGDRYISVRSGTQLSLTALSNYVADPWLIIHGEYGDSSTTATPSASSSATEYPYVAVAGGLANYGKGSVSGSIANGYMTVSFDTIDIPSTISQFQYPLPDPAGGPWLQVTKFWPFCDPGFYIYSMTTENATSEHPNAAATAETRPKSVLTVVPSHPGTVSLQNAKRYYVGPRAGGLNAELVGVDMNPNGGPAIKGLKVSDGVPVWRYTGEDTVTDFFSLDDMTTATTVDGLYTELPVYIEMVQDATVTPEFDVGTLYFIEPDGDPVTDNHYVFHSGVCTVDPEAGGVNVFNCTLKWYLEGIEGSTLQVSPDPPHTLTPVFTYSGLPTANAQFGDKNLRASSIAGGSADTIVQIFFEVLGNDHPEITGNLDQWLSDPSNGSSAVPNWYYYWKQTSANMGPHVLDSSSHTNPPWAGENPNKPMIGLQCAAPYHIAYAVIGPRGENQIIPFDVNVEGIDTFAWVCRHELMHKTVWEELWPPPGDWERNGAILDENGNVVDDANGDGITDYLLDFDMDALPDQFENEVRESGMTYYDSTMTSTSGYQADLEDYVLWRQATDSPWQPGAAKSEDWSHPGQQSDE